MKSNEFAQQEFAGPELAVENFRRDSLWGLSRNAKTLPCKYLYDEAGAGLFEAICELDEYYLARAESAILRRNIQEIAARFGSGCRIVELGSGNSAKTRLLLDHLDSPASYVPIDVAQAQLFDCAAHLARDYPTLDVSPICADYTGSFEMPLFSANSVPTAALFFGSTIGNFEPDEAVRFLRRLTRICHFDAGLLIGVDLKKDPAVLHRAYNDSQGLTAAFNLNLLTRANRELEARFDLSLFEHRAFYERRAGRIEMHLMSRWPQTVCVSGHEFSFRQGESIRTEHSYKYHPEEFRRLAAEAGYETTRCWTDENHWFSLQHLRPHSP